MSAFTILTVVAAALGTLGLGTAILHLLRFRDIPLLLKLGAGYALGTVAIGQLASWGSLAEIPLTTASWAAVTIGLLAGAWLLYTRGAPPAREWAPAHICIDPVILSVLILMTLHFAITLTNNLTRPIFAWDAFTTWMYRAKAWALQDAITPMAFVPNWIAEGATRGYAIYADQYSDTLSSYAAITSSLSGGVFMNSPSVSAYSEACKLFPDEPIRLLSLGTGELTRPIPYEEARTWGSALWVMSILDCMFDGASKAADYQMRLFLGDNYLRLQTPLHYASDDMDDASKGNIRNLKQTARELIAREEVALQRFLALGESVVKEF
ncbi:hypothetical protein N9U42_03760 [Luminiphilus sp.]|nr:hypothetical protein [Luminiphilus sp.]MDA9711465.1 hypothetical protein [Luminiphilus sp.]